MNFVGDLKGFLRLFIFTIQINSILKYLLLLELEKLFDLITESNIESLIACQVLLQIKPQLIQYTTASVR